MISVATMLATTDFSTIGDGLSPDNLRDALAWAMVPVIFGPRRHRPRHRHAHHGGARDIHGLMWVLVPLFLAFYAEDWLSANVF